MELPSRYNPQETEDKWYNFWGKSGFFHVEPDSKDKPFSIVIPPPNVTGILHMGHALNNTIQDILVRYHRMKGEKSLWMPGTDHAGIATQNVVEKAIAKEGLTRRDLGRDKFIRRVWQWKEQYGSTIIRQLKKLGASCDWQRARFTMDEDYSDAVVEAFIRLYEKGLIYRGSYIINWCPRCRTALSDEEAPHQEVQGNLYYIKYPLSTRHQAPGTRQNMDMAYYIVVATTRPETMLGDSAVAVNPKDKRYKEFIGKSLILPLINREIKIIADSMVDLKFGTGAVKVTPAHDPNDYLLGKRHKLDFINLLRPDGSMNENAGKYKDMDRFEAREAILKDLKEKDLLEKIEPHKLSAGHCYRCRTLIEPYLSEQWFVKMRPLAKPAIAAVKKGKIQFHPKRWTKVYLDWMENIQDWCISRQIWWGHRIPVYYCRKCQEEGLAFSGNRLAVKTANRKPQTEEGIIVSKVKPEKCPNCGSIDIIQDEDVLDTWFSSWLWPFATFYWPNTSRTASRSPQTARDLDYFYPTSVLVTAPEIIFFWVARMIMAGIEFMKDIPFRDVYIHGTVRDLTGKKMSKSLGNIIDPLEIIEEFGADALRFSIISITAVGQDIFLSKDKFHLGRNFANKIWNASRFILMNLDASSIKVELCQFFKKEDLDTINRWILSRFYSVLKATNKALDTYRFNEAAAILYAFFWHEFCDWYLEIIKSDIKNRHNQVLMYKLLEKFLRIMHPFMPFITEEIWQRLPNEGGSIMTRNWPHIQQQMIDRKHEKEIKSIFALITQIRNLRNETGELKSAEKVKISLYSGNKKKKEIIRDNSALIVNLAKLQELEILSANKKPPATRSAVAEDIDIYLHFSGLLDVSREERKIKADLKDKRKFIERISNKLKNPDFVNKAPREVVERELLRKAKLEDELRRMEKLYNELLS